MFSQRLLLNLFVIPESLFIALLIASLIEDDGQYFMADEGSDGPSAIIIKVF